MANKLASIDPLVILLACPVIVVAVCGYILFRATIGRKR